MDQLSCPHCNGPVLNDRRMAGQVVACPSCRNPFRMPEAEEPEEKKSPSSPAPPTSAPAKPPPEKAKPDKPKEAKPASKPEPSAPSGEPWYYDFLVNWSQIFLWLTVSLTALAFLISLVLVMGAVSDRTGGIFFGILCLAVILVALAFFLLGVFYFIALALLLVDAAHNLRELRKTMGKK